MPLNVTTNYRPSQHGLKFGNGFEHEIAFGWRTHGRCNGMAHLSCDYFFAGRTPPNASLVDYGVKPLSGIAAASWQPGRADLFCRQDGDLVATRVFRDGHWSDWVQATWNTITGAPAVASWGPGRLDLVFRGAGGEIRHESWSGDQAAMPPPCTRPPNMGAEIGALSDLPPAITAPFENRLEVFVKGLNGNLWIKYSSPEELSNGQPWTGTGDLGRPDGIEITSAPAAASKYGWMNAVVRGSDGALWHKEWRDNQWQPWRSAGGFITSAPALASPAPGRLEAYARGRDGSMYINVFQNQRWEGWASLGAPPPGVSEDQPAAFSFPGLLGVFAKANDGSVWHRRWFQGGWQPWESTEPVISDEGKILARAAFDRMMTSTHNKLIALGGVAFVLGPVALPLLAVVGPPGKFLSWRVRSRQDNFRDSNGPELDELLNRLRAGRPAPLGLIADGGWGHEVVAWGAVIDCNEAPDGGPGTGDGPLRYVRIYDPTYPGCDDIWLKYDPANMAITERPGDSWLGAFVRSDYEPQAPPL